MEAVGTISEGDQWNSSFNGICSDEADFMSQLLGACSVPNEVPPINGHDFSIPNWAAYESNPSIGGVGESSMYSSDDQTSVYSWSSMYPSSSANQECYYPSINNNNNVAHHIFVGNNNLMTMDYCLMMDGKINSHVIDGGDDDFLNQDNLSNGSNVEYDDEKVVSENVVPRGKETLISEPLMKESNNNNPSEISRKRPRIPPGEFQRSKRNIKINKCRKVDDSDEDNNNNSNNNNNTDKVLHRQSSSGCCSEDDSNGSHEPSRAGPGSSSKGSGKTRACRGSATDPQSLYARKRRERINERLKILQNLVPNGTKVDISTMLEEAVQYVKFLQLQIKLLSSEDMWMYAPIAYNGMNIGLDNLKIPNIES